MMEYNQHSCGSPTVKLTSDKESKTHELKEESIANRSEKVKGGEMPKSTEVITENFDEHVFSSAMSDMLSQITTNSSQESQGTTLYKERMNELVSTMLQQFQDQVQQIRKEELMQYKKEKKILKSNHVDEKEDADKKGTKTIDEDEESLKPDVVKEDNEEKDCNSPSSHYVNPGFEDYNSYNEEDCDICGESISFGESLATHKLKAHGGTKEDGKDDCIMEDASNLVNDKELYKQKLQESPESSKHANDFKKFDDAKAQESPKSNEVKATSTKFDNQDCTDYLTFGPKNFKDIDAIKRNPEHYLYESTRTKRIQMMLNDIHDFTKAEAKITDKGVKYLEEQSWNTLMNKALEFSQETLCPQLLTEYRKCYGPFEYENLDKEGTELFNKFHNDTLDHDIISVTGNGCCLMNSFR